MSSGRVAGRGDGEGVAVVRLLEPGAAVEEAREAVGRELVAVAR